MNREDLRVTVFTEGGMSVNPGEAFTRPVSDAELAELIEQMDYVNFSDLPEELERRGWVKLPDCDACEGGRVPCPHDPPYSTPHNVVCPSCKGSGKGRLVNLTEISALAYMPDLTNPVRQVLAALDKGETP